jgi:hypothetical protein
VTPAEQARAFAAALLGDHGEMLRGFQLTLTHFASGASGPLTRWLPATAGGLASAITEAAEGDAVLGVYVGVGLTRGPRADPAGKRPLRLTKATVDGLAWLWIDIDIAGGGHAGSKMSLVPDMATALALVRSVGLPPTVLVNTGHGIQAHWRMREPFIYGATDVDDDGAPIVDETRIDADRAAGEELAWAWVKSFQVRARERGGWHVDPTTDPSRLVRCPGSVNTKVDGDHRAVVMLECEPSRVYDIEDFQAVLMPEKVLAPLRYDTVILSGEMAGVDLPALWSQAEALPEHEPTWLTDIFAQNIAPELEALWLGERDAEYANDDSSIDMALTRVMLKWGMTPADVCLAIMCRRLRRCAPGKKIDKVNPARRTTYLGTTVGRVAAELRVEAAKLAAAEQASEETVAALAQASGPVPLRSVPPVEEEPPPPPDPFDDFPPDDEGPTDVGDSTPESNADGPTVGGETEPAARPILRSVPPVETSVHDVNPDAVETPVLGFDDSTPKPPPDTERPTYRLLEAQLGLPGEVIVVAVAERRMAEENEMRLWLFRRETDAVQGGDWGPGRIKGTRWHSKATWSARTRVAEILQHDLNLFTELARTWRSDPNGLKLLYKLARKLTEGTPEQVVTSGILSLVRHATGTGHFTTAVATRDPWVADGELWVPRGNILDAISRLGFSPPKAVPFADTLEEMRCKMRTRMSVAEGERTVYDIEPWVRVPEELLGAELWAATLLRAEQRDVDDRRNDVRVIRPHE